ncbi:hypothetical protein ACH5RR_023526 [Cinchona calisaya]|uniref:Uncharacterized protein n=1 Tax=Cinchona calisaya TaxID=153742 RepID=A0ABD2ZCF7_9GENT
MKIQCDRELNEYYAESLQCDKLVELYIETFFKEIRQLEMGSNFEDHNRDDDDYYNREEDEDFGSDNSHTSDSGGSEFSSKDSDYDMKEDDDEYDENMDGTTK